MTVTVKVTTEPETTKSRFEVEGVENRKPSMPLHDENKSGNTMKIRAGFKFGYECPQPTPMLLALDIHPSRRVIC